MKKCLRLQQVTVDFNFLNREGHRTKWVQTKQTSLKKMVGEGMKLEGRLGCQVKGGPAKMFLKGFLKFLLENIVFWAEAVKYSTPGLVGGLVLH